MTSAQQTPDLKTLSLNERVNVIRRQASIGSDLCQDAAQYLEDMKYHQSSLNELVAELNKYVDDESDDALLEMLNIFEVINDVIEAMHDLKNKQITLSQKAQDIEVIEKKLLEKKSFKDAQKHLDTEGEAFLKQYNSIKEKLGLKTQQDVADKTGIDRRQISRIENAKHKPQFKTIQKLALGFGVQVSYFKE